MYQFCRLLCPKRVTCEWLCFQSIVELPIEREFSLLSSVTLKGASIQYMSDNTTQRAKLYKVTIHERGVAKKKLVIHLYTELVASIETPGLLIYRQYIIWLRNFGIAFSHAICVIVLKKTLVTYY